MANKPYQSNEFQEEQESGFDYRMIIDAVILNWHWFLISIIVCVTAAFLYLRYQSPVYTSYSKVLIKEDDPYKRARSSSMADFSQLGIVTNSYGFENELEVIGSKSLAKRAVTNLKLYVQYAYEGRVRDQDLYRDTPLLADMSGADLEALSGTLFLRVKKDGEVYKVEFDTPEGKKTAEVKSFPARVKTHYGWVSLDPNPKVKNFDTRTLFIYIYKPTVMGNVYQARTSVAPINDMTTIARLSMNETRAERAIDYLTELIRVYNEDANENKNEVALKTEAFINKRIKIIDAELGSTDTELETYKKRNQLVNLTSDAQAAYKGVEEYQAKQIELQTQMMLVKSLKEFVDNPSNYMEIIPANIGLTDASLNKVIADYNLRVMERNRLMKTAHESSPVVTTISNAISTMYPGIRHSLSSVYENLRLQKRSVDEQYNAFIGRLSDAPTQERVLTDMSRQQSVKAALYQILLQKREENAISLASTVDKAQVIDMPETAGVPISPNRKMILLIGLLAGVAIPAVWIWLCNVLRYRIEGRNDIEKLTALPILSDIFVAGELRKGQRSIVVRENSNDMMEETFRNLRTNLGFVMTKDERVLLCTSVMPGEGKTFVSTNLAMSMALMGRKVLLVGLDIRKPRLAKLFGIHTGDRGLTNYLASSDDTDEFLREQLFPSGMNANLDVLPAGLIPPNPAELIVSERLDQAFARFREWYDLIIIDTPPLGLVSDTLSLGRVADASVVVVRCDFTLKRNFDMINSLNTDNKLPKMNLVLNGVDLKQRKYGYYYGYGNYGRYGRYGSYGHYGHYGSYGHYGDDTSVSKRRGKGWVSEERFDK